MENHAHSFGRRAVKSARRAFTIIEVLLAIALISLLAFIVVGNLDTLMTAGRRKSQSRWSRTRSRLR